MNKVLLWLLKNTQFLHIVSWTQKKLPIHEDYYIHYNKFWLKIQILCLKLTYLKRTFMNRYFLDFLLKKVWSDSTCFLFLIILCLMLIWQLSPTWARPMIYSRILFMLFTQLRTTSLLFILQGPNCLTPSGAQLSFHLSNFLDL